MEMIPKYELYGIKSFRTAVLFIVVMHAIALLAFTGGALAREDDDAVASMTKVSGKVEVSDDGEEWFIAEEGEPLYEGTMVKTGPAAEVTIAWNSGHTLKLFELASLTVEEARLSPRSEKTTLDISRGTIFAKTGKLRSATSNFSVKTPTAIAAVRGTTFMVEVKPDNSSVISLMDGQLEVVGEQVQMILQENNSVTVTPGMKQAPEARNIDNETRNQMQQWSKEADAETGRETGSQGQETSSPAAETEDEPSETAAEPEPEIDPTDQTDMVMDQVIEETIDIIDQQDILAPEDTTPDLPPSPPDMY